jgi:23S rRNA maturation-related 3'-5' exoribonuclease YhaM
MAMRLFLNDDQEKEITKILFEKQTLTWEQLIDYLIKFYNDNKDKVK